MVKKQMIDWLMFITSIPFQKHHSKKNHAGPSPPPTTNHRIRTRTPTPVDDWLPEKVEMQSFWVHMIKAYYPCSKGCQLLEKSFLHRKHGFMNQNKKKIDDMWIMVCDNHVTWIEKSPRKLYFRRYYYTYFVKKKNGLSYLQK